MQRLTALELRSGVKSSSAISTQPRERTEKRMAGDLGGEFRDSELDAVPRATGKLLRLFGFSIKIQSISKLIQRLIFEMEVDNRYRTTWKCINTYLKAISSLVRILSRSESVKLVVLLGTTGVKLALIACIKDEVSSRAPRVKRVNIKSTRLRLLDVI